MPEFKKPHGKKRKKARKTGRNSAQVKKKQGKTRSVSNRAGQFRSVQGGNNAGHSQQQMRQKRKHKQNNIIYHCMFAFIFVVILSVLSVTVLFNMREIAVEGESVYSDDEIISAAKIPQGVNLIRYNSSESVKNILDNLVYIDEAEVRKDYPSKLTVTVTGAEKMANILLPDGKCLLVSGKGKILDKLDYNTEQPVITGYEPISTEIGGFISSEDEKKTELIYIMIAEAEKAEFNNITEIDISDSLKIVITYDGRIRIIVGAAVDLREKLLAAKAIIEIEDVTGTITGTLNQTEASKGYFLADIIAEGYDVLDGYVLPDETTETPEENGNSAENPE